MENKKKMNCIFCLANFVVLQERWVRRRFLLLIFLEVEEKKVLYLRNFKLRLSEVSRRSPVSTSEIWLFIINLLIWYSRLSESISSAEWMANLILRHWTSSFESLKLSWFLRGFELISTWLIIFLLIKCRIILEIMSTISLAFLVDFFDDCLQMSITNYRFFPMCPSKNFFEAQEYFFVKSGTRDIFLKIVTISKKPNRWEPSLIFILVILQKKSNFPSKNFFISTTKHVQRYLIL